MAPKFDKMSQKNSSELIVYQIGEVKNLLENINIRMDSYQDKTDKRLSALELAQAAQINSKIDVQKIILAAFSLVSTVVAIALGINQGK